MTVTREEQAAAGGMFASFRAPGFMRVWVGAVLFALGIWMERLAVGWFVLDVTGSVFLAALSLGIRSIPNLILGPVGGAVSDRLPRGRVLMVTSIVRAVAAGLMALVVVVDVATVPLLLALVFVTAATLAFHNTSLQPLQAELAGPARLGTAISLTSFGQRSIGAAGALGGGLLIGSLGPAPTFLVAAVPLVLAGVVFAGVPSPPKSPVTRPHLARDVIEGLRLLWRTPAIRLLLGMMIVIEILGFSFASLLPAVAERVLDVGPERLGVLTAAVSVGAMFGTALLVVTADRLPRGLMLVSVFATFGLLVVVLGNSDVFWLSVAATAGIGASAAMVDALEWIMLQASVHDEGRGRALGGWNFAIGWG
ncbi:MAG: MFS transporter, partial [Chloroflexi bacterium]|nr:MFS transporter [Chloroflexota bacterium]